MGRAPLNEEEISERYLRLVYGQGHVSPQPALAREFKREHPWLSRRHAWAEGKLSPEPPAWGMHPLIALTHSSFSRTAKKQFAVSVRAVLAAGADVNVRWRSPEGYSLSALYGAAGKNHQEELTAILLEAGADPNDGESLYHSVESLPIVQLLLKAGARTQGTNALARSLDMDGLAVTRLLLKHGADPAEGPGGGALLWAIRRRRSTAHVRLLLAHGADPHAALHGVSAYKAALWMGMPEAAALLRRRTGEAKLAGRDAFLAACGCGDAPAAERALAADPDLIRRLPVDLLGLLPLQVAAGNDNAARLMVKLGWPLTVKGGDWKATPLNLAVFRGNAKLTRFLLENGASWRETHGFGDNVRGTLSYASREKPIAGGDWKGCARVLTAHGMPPLV